MDMQPPQDQDAGPPRTEATPEEAKGFLERLRTHLVAQGVSERTVERDAGYGAGTISKIRSGALMLTPDKARNLAEAAKVHLVELVKGTSLEWFLRIVPSPQSELLQRTERARDEALAQTKLAEEVAVAAKAEAEEAKRQNAKLVAENRNLLAQVAALKAESATLRKEMANATSQLQRVQSEASIKGAALTAWQRQCHDLATSRDQWMEEAGRQEAQVNHARRLLAACQQELALRPTPGGVLAAALLAFGIGVGASKS